MQARQTNSDGILRTSSQDVGRTRYYKPLPPCSCSAAAIYEKEREEAKVHQFVMGLDEARFGIVCQGIIAADLTVDLGEVYARVVREEQRLASTIKREAQHSAVDFVAKKEQAETNNCGRRVVTCFHCGRRGHEKSNCWQLVGFPDWCEETPPTRSETRGGRGGRGRGASNSDRNRSTTARANTAHATSSNSSIFSAFTEEQWRALTQIVNEKSKSSDKLTGKKYGDLILDTRASHHMTGELSFLENIFSIPPCPVGFADGNKTYATHTGVFHLSKRIVLSNVLFVPNLNCSLISV